jgi:putative intracellular protease/amidase
MKHILFIVTSTDKIGTNNYKTGYEFSEVADPYLEFINAGFNVDFASILGGKPPEDGYDKTHKNSVSFRNSAGFQKLNFSHKLENVNIDAYDAIFFPGGLGPMVDLLNNKTVNNWITKFHETGKIISAVCHGSVVFLNVKLSDGNFLIEGKKITSFTTAEEEIKKHHLEQIIPFLLDEALKNRGANFSNKKPFESYVVIDENIITGQNPASATGVAKTVIQKLIE